MAKFKGKVDDVYSVFTETNTDTLCLTPKGDFNKNFINDPKVYRGEIEIDHMEQGGSLYIGISKYATCTSVQDCRVEFDYNGELPDLQSLEAD